MAALPLIYRQSLTGRVRPRRTWTGRVVLQVEVLFERLGWPGPGDEPRRVLGRHTEWRDARTNDPLEHVYGVPVAMPALPPDSPVIPQPTPEPWR